VAGEDILRKVVLQTHGVDRSRFWRAAVSENRNEFLEIMSVGRLVPQKGYEVLIAALRILDGRGVKFLCRIVGPGDPNTVLGGFDPASLRNGRIDFSGSVNHGELPSLYRSADVFVIPCVIDPSGGRDGLPNVLLEAMASGLACVGSDIASIPEAMSDGETGLLVPPGDSRALAEALGRLAADPELRRRIGAAAVEVVARKFDRQVAMGSLFQTFCSLSQAPVDGGAT
jgi:glycosyltransferase involved in cell wall biosynthesis